MTLFICLGIALIYFGGIWHRPLFAPEEIGCALTAKEMMLSGKIFSPTLNGLPCIDNPPPYYWAVAGALKVFGENTFALRFASAFFTLLTAGVLYLFCFISGDRRRAVVSALLYLCCGTVFAGASRVSPDSVPAFFTVVSLIAGYFFYMASTRILRWHSLLIGAVFAVAGCFISGPAGALAFVSVLALFGIAQKKYLYCLAGTIGSAAVLLLPCGLFYLGKSHPNFVIQGFLPHCHYALSGMNILWAVAGVLPVLFILPSGIVQVAKNGRKFFLSESYRLFSLVSLLVLFIIFVLLGNNSIALALPVFPFFAILAADALLEAEKAGNIALSSKVLHIFCMVLGAVTVLFTLWHFLPAISYKWKLYTSGNIIPVVMISGLLLLWYSMAAKEKDTFPERKFLYFCIGTGVFLVSFSHIIPFKVLKNYDQTGFIQKAVLPHLRSGVEVFADGSLAPAAAWTLRRNAEISLDPGEFLPVLHRTGKTALAPEILKKRILSAVKSGRQAVVFTRSRKLLPEISLYRTTVRSGDITVVIYGELLK